MKRYSVDRIENEIIVLIGDDGTVCETSTKELGFTVAEKDIVDFDDESRSYIKNESEKDKREETNRKRLKALFERNKK